MRTLLRSHAVSVACLREIFSDGDIYLQDEQTGRHAADIHTKAFLNAEAWGHVVRLIGLGDPNDLTAETEIYFWANPPPTKAALQEADEAVAPSVRMNGVSLRSLQTGAEETHTTR